MSPIVRSSRRRHRLASTTLSIALVALLGSIAILGAVSTTFAQIALPTPVTIKFDDEEEVIEVPSILWGVTGHAKVGATSMSELNSAIGGVNDRIAVQGTGGIDYTKPSAGVSFSLGLRAIVMNRLILWTDYEKYDWSSEVGGQTAGSSLELPADIISVRTGWNLLSGPYKRFGFGFGLSHWDARSRQVFRLAEQERESLRIPSIGENDEIGEIRFDGDTIGQDYFSFLEIPLTERLYVTASMGWRIAKIDQLDLESEGSLWLDALTDEPYFLHTPFAESQIGENGLIEAVAAGEHDELDYSGFYGQIGFTIFWNPPDRF